MEEFTTNEQKAIKIALGLMRPDNLRFLDCPNKQQLKDCHNLIKAIRATKHLL